MAKTSKNKTNLRPLGGKVLIKLIEEKSKEKKSASGIIIPETAEKDNLKEGEVIVIGTGKTNENGEIIPFFVKEGDKVLFKEFAGDEVSIEGEEYQILSEENILGIME